MQEIVISDVGADENNQQQCWCSFSFMIVPPCPFLLIYGSNCLLAWMWMVYCKYYHHVRQHTLRLCTYHKDQPSCNNFPHCLFYRTLSFIITSSVGILSDNGFILIKHDIQVYHEKKSHEIFFVILMSKLFPVNKIKIKRSQLKCGA